MKVLLVSHTCQSRAEGQAKAFFTARDPRIELRVLVPDRWRHYGAFRAPEAPMEGGFAYEIGRVRWPWLPGAQSYLHHYAELGRLLREYRPDIIDLWEEPWGLVSAQACWWRDRVLPEAAVISETEQNLSKVLPPPFESLRRYVLAKADFLVGRSEEAVAVARAKGFRGPARVVGNGFDPRIFYPRDRQSCRRKLFPEWGLDTFVAICAGRMVPEKGIEEILAALPGAPPHLRVAFVGSGPWQQTLQAAAATSLRGRIQCRSALPPAELAEAFASADACLLISRTTSRWKEQFGRVIVEAQACGVPVLGSNSGAIPRVVGSGGLIVPERDPSALRDALTALATQPALQASLRSKALENAANYRLDRIGAEMAAIFAEARHARRGTILETEST